MAYFDIGMLDEAEEESALVLKVDPGIATSCEVRGIAARGKDWIRLEAASWFLTAHLVIQLDAAQLSIATFIRYDRPIAAFIWRPAAAVHRRLMPGLLQQTVRLQARGQASRRAYGH